MRATYLLGIALAAAVAVVACGAGPTDSLTDGTDNGGEGDEGDGTSTPRKPGTKAPTGSSSSGSTTPGTTPGTDPGVPGGPVPTNSPGGKDFFKASVFPTLNTKCASCHMAAGPGPAWLSTDSEKAYAQLFQVGYVITNSRIVQKPAHGGSTTNVLSSAEAGTYNQWVAMELKDGGTKAPPNVLAKLGGCFDKTKFDAMQLAQWRTTQRTNNNNTNQVTPWNENANNCTGCNNAPCSTCHSSDPATNFNNAVGNGIVEGNNQNSTVTFENTKLTTPAYITKYFGVSPDGKPIASDGIKKKSEATMKDKAYTHPMYKLTAAQQTALDAFVLDAVTKYAAGTCGQ